MDSSLPGLPNTPFVPFDAGVSADGALPSVPDAGPSDVPDGGPDGAAPAVPDAGSAPDAGSTSDAGGTDAAAGGACGGLTYDSFGRGFFQSYCVSCHSAPSPGRPALATLEAIRGSSPQIKAEAVTATSMPPIFSLAVPSAAERQSLGRWLDCGAP